MSSIVDAILFDFDGVIIDSVLLKENVFKAMIQERAPEILGPAMEYFLSNGGTSRVEKFRWIWANLVREPLSDQAASDLGAEFARRVREGVLHCRFIPGAKDFLEDYSSQVACFVISGTPEEELRDIVQERGLSAFFRGVFGSPRKKKEIGESILASERLDPRRVRFIGDATTDRDAARAIGVPFIGLSGPHLTPYLDGTEVMIDDLRALPKALGLAR